ncbi:DUF935 family protein [Ignatzschineria rhizosphaerae]|uniref:DUF935 family protein n=1 Tax=Ignatzschineria rhizosphaerae TaxID=2923279 RepID=A0ABY3X3S2_9GAMM|nr:DUF935 family protein [Ignatzschineria rhizosphaerae]UNM95677.1 DUF935 family protein [Ignatzschineria rhizosphaerae]
MGVIVDQWGRPIVGEMQTEMSEQLSRIAQSAPDAVASGLTPRKLAGVVQSAYGGDLSAISDLGHELETKNGHLFAEMSKRKRSITLLDWSLKPPKNATPEEERDTEMIEEALRDADWFNDMLFDALDGILKGFSCQELQWNTEGEIIRPKKVIWRPQSMFTVNQDDRNDLRINDGSMGGQALRKFGWIQHRAPAMSGYLGETTLTNVLAWPFIFASYPIRDMLEFLEIYGIPMRLGKYPSGATDKEKSTLLNAIMSIGHNAGGIIPQGMAIDFQEAAQGGSAEFLSVIEWAEKMISKIILGGTLTSQADGVTSTNALGTVHDGGRKEIMHSDIAALEPTITRDLIIPMWVMNAGSYSRPTRYPRFEIDTSEPEDLAYYATALPAFVGMGLRIPKSWAHDKLQIPEAAEDEEILSKPEAPAYDPYSGMGFAGLSAQKVETRFTPGQNKIEDGINGFSPEAFNKAIDPLIEPIAEAVRAGGLENAKEMIAELYADLDTTEMEEMLVKAIFVSELLGGANANS